MEFKAIQAEQIKEQAEGTLKQRAKEKEMAAYHAAIEVKRLLKTHEIVPDEFKPAIAAALETAEEAADKAQRKSDRAKEGIKTSESESKAAKVEFLRQWLLQIEAEYVAHQTQRDERARILEGDTLTDDERAQIGTNWQQNVQSMEALESTHAVCLEEMSSLGVDPVAPAQTPPGQAVNTGTLLPAPEPPGPKSATTKKVKA
jgi:hypothetical protein